MKILHTADWHLGKKLYAASRMDEQRAALHDLERICDERGADVVIVAGDVFDTHNPSAEAEELFYSSAVRLARNRVFIALAGNHDDADRLAAPDALARACEIILAGGDDLSHVRTEHVTGGPNSLTVRIGGERLNIAVLPFLSESRLSGGYTDGVRERLNRGAAAFTDDGFNMVAAHLFTAGGETTEGDERTLGTALIVPNDVIPPCHYAALGHIHKPMTVSKSRNIEYAGSLLNYHFGDATNKSAILVDTATGLYERIPIAGGKPLVRVTAATFDEAMDKLAAVTGYAELIYSGEPLKPSETAALKDTPCVSVRVEIGRTEKVTRRRVMSDRELFEEFYRARYGADNAAVTELFMRFLGGDDVTA